MALIQVKNLTAGYEALPVVKDVHLRISDGEIVGIHGPNGCGKSTLLKALFGLTPWSRGTVEVDGQRVTPKPRAMIRRGLLYVPQGVGVFETLTVRENLELFCRGTEGVLQRGTIGHVYDSFPTLEAKQGILGKNLSGGERQLVSLARLLLIRPRTVLLDEPTVGLAPDVRLRLLTLLEDIRATVGFGALIVEHDRSFLRRIADRVIEMKEGRLGSRPAES